MSNPKPKKWYKAVLIEDGSTICKDFAHPMTARKIMENHSQYHVLRYGIDYKIVLDESKEQATA